MEYITTILIFISGGFVHAYLADAEQMLIRRGWMKTWMGAIEYLVLGFIVLVAYFIDGGWYSWTGPLFLSLPLRWYFHDSAMNRLRGKPFEYIGKESYFDDALNWWKMLTGAPHFVLKGGLIYIAYEIQDKLL